MIPISILPKRRITSVSNCNETIVSGDPQEQASDFTTNISYQDLTGDLADDPTTGRRDSSDIIKVGSYYYVYYTKTGTQSDGYNGTIWVARSLDGLAWEERNICIDQGTGSDWDNEAVFTPNILVWNGIYYLYYTGLGEPPITGAEPVYIGVASSNNPEGPFTKHASNPIVSPSFDATRFDQIRVDDTVMVTHGCNIYLFYKGRNDNFSNFVSFGAAINSNGNPLGPFTKIDGPNSDKSLVFSSHDSGGYKLREGFVIINWFQDEPNDTKLYYTPDFYNFTLKNTILGSPSKAVSVYREDFQKSFGNGISWGIVTAVSPTDYVYLRRINYDGLAI